MAKQPDTFSRYHVVGNGSIEATYSDANQLVLVNKLGLRDPLEVARKEHEGLATAYATLFRKLPEGDHVTPTLLQQAHGLIYGELYEWAGRWRQVDLAKGGMKWPPAHLTDANMKNVERDVLRRFAAKDLKTDEQFCHAVAVIQGEVLAVHPFREGNARTVKLCTDILAEKTGRPILQYDRSQEGQAAYIAAHKRVISAVDYKPLERLIEGALRRAHEVSREPKELRVDQVLDRAEQLIGQTLNQGQAQHLSPATLKPDRNR